MLYKYESMGVALLGLLKIIIILFRLMCKLLGSGPTKYTGDLSYTNYQTCAINFYSKDYIK